MSTSTSSLTTTAINPSTACNPSLASFLAHTSTSSASPSAPTCTSTPTPTLGRIPVSAISNWHHGPIPSALAFPYTLNEEKLRCAISKAAGVWPTVAGRFERSTPESERPGKYFIQITSSPIPFSTQTLPITSPFPTTDTIQPSSLTSTYIPSLGSSYFIPGSNTPLLSVRLTHLDPAEGWGSVLGIAWAHVLGDAAACFLFLQHLAWLYVHLEVEDDTTSGIAPTHSALPRPPFPTFGVHADIPYPASKSALEEFYLTQLEPLSLDVGRGRYNNADKLTERVVWMLSKGDVEGMRRDIAEAEEKDGVGSRGANGGGEAGGVKARLTTQDVVNGWWVTVLERAGVIVNRVVYTISYRTLHTSHPGFPTELSTLAGNVAQMFAVPVSLPSSSSPSVPSGFPETEHPNPFFRVDTGPRASHVARSIRSEMERLTSSPTRTLEWLSNAADRMQVAVDEGKMQCMIPKEDEVVVNSNLRYDWAVPFHSPSSENTKYNPHYYTSWSAPRVLRVYQPNGILEGFRTPEVTFNVPNGQKGVYEGILKSDRDRWART